MPARLRTRVALALAAMVACVLVAGMGCRREQAQPAQIVIEQPPSPPPEPPPPPPLPEEAGAIKLVPAPEVVSSKVKAEGEVLVVDWRGRLFRGSARTRLRRTSTLHEGTRNGWVGCETVWSPDGDAILLLADLATSYDWFLIQGGRALWLNDALRGLGGGPGSIRWIDDEHIAAGVSGAGLLLMSAKALTAHPERFVELLADGDAERSRFVISPDGRFAVVGVGKDAHVFRIGTRERGTPENYTDHIGTCSCAEGSPPAWLPGETERFVVSTADGQYAIWGLEDREPDKRDFTAHGPPPDIWTANSRAHRPSPDYTRLAVETKGATLWVLGTEEARRVGASHAPGASYEWSPDGRWLACGVRTLAGTKPFLLYSPRDHRLWRVDGADRPVHMNPEARWSANSRYVAFRSAAGSRKCELFVADVEKLTCTQVTGTGAQSRDRAYAKAQIEGWTPDGGHLVYSLHDAWSGDSGGEVWVMSADGTRRRKLLDSEERFTVHVQGQPSRYEE